MLGIGGNKLDAINLVATTFLRLFGLFQVKRQGKGSLTHLRVIAVSAMGNQGIQLTGQASSFGPGEVGCSDATITAHAGL